MNTPLARLRAFAASRFRVPEALAPHQFRPAAILLSAKVLSPVAGHPADQKIVGLARLRQNGWLDVIAYEAVPAGSEVEPAPAAFSFGPAVASLALVTWLGDEELEGDSVSR